MRVRASATRFGVEHRARVAEQRGGVVEIELQRLPIRASCIGLAVAREERVREHVPHLRRRPVAHRSIASRSASSVSPASAFATAARPVIPSFTGSPICVDHGTIACGFSTSCGLIGGGCFWIQ